MDWYWEGEEANPSAIFWSRSSPCRASPLYPLRIAALQGELIHPAMLEARNGLLVAAVPGSIEPGYTASI